MNTFLNGGGIRLTLLNEVRGELSCKGTRVQWMLIQRSRSSWTDFLKLSGVHAGERFHVTFTRKTSKRWSLWRNSGCQMPAARRRELLQIWAKVEEIVLKRQDKRPEKIFP